VLLPVTGHGTDRLRVRVTDDIGAVLGTDGVEYDLQAGDTVDLPAATAAPVGSPSRPGSESGPPDAPRTGGSGPGAAV